MRKARFTEPITIALSNEMHSKIKELSDTEDVSMAKVIRILLDEGLVKKENKHNLKTERE